MRCVDDWQPTKFVYEKDCLVASKKKEHCSVGSRLITDLVAGFYGQYVPRFATGRLLDLGSGSVPLFECYRPYISENICVDWDQSLDGGRHLDHQANLEQKLPFADREFTTIILSDVLEHIFSPMNLWIEMARVLKPGGHILLSTPFLYWIHEAPNDYYRYTEHALRRFAYTSEFSIVVLRPLGGAPEVVADIFAKRLQTLPFLGGTAASVVQSVTKALFTEGPFRQFSARTAERFPLGYFLVAERLD